MAFTGHPSTAIHQFLVEGRGRGEDYLDQYSLHACQTFGACLLVFTRPLPKRQEEILSQFVVSFSPSFCPFSSPATSSSSNLPPASQFSSPSDAFAVSQHFFLHCILFTFPKANKWPFSFLGFKSVLTLEGGLPLKVFWFESSLRSQRTVHAVCT